MEEKRKKERKKEKEQMYLCETQSTDINISFWLRKKAVISAYSIFITGF